MGKVGTRNLVCYGTTAAIIVGLVIAIIVLATADNDGDNERSPVVRPEDDTEVQLNLLTYFKIKDGLQIKWYSSATTEQDVRNAITGRYHMLEMDVSTIKTGLSLASVLGTLKDSTVGIKLNMPTEETFREAVDAIKHVGFTRPVMFSVPIFSLNFSWSRCLQVLHDANLEIPVGVNIDLRNECCDGTIGIGTLEYIDSLVKALNYSTTLEIDPRNLPDSWNNIRRFLNTAYHTNLIVSPNETRNNDTIYDLLLVRNDADSNRVFYNMRGTIYDEFLTLASTAGSSLLYFNIHPRHADKIKWSHNTDTWQLLNKAITGDVMMIEGDIMLKGQGTSGQENIPIMAHDAGDDNNITFVQWIDEIIKVDKGMKFDFKYIDAVRPALEIAFNKKSQIKGPIWVNADILKGPNAADSRIPPAQFLEAVKLFSGVTLSLGWTTVRKDQAVNLNYTMDMIKEMYDVVKDLPQPVTFPVRAEQFRDSWTTFSWLLQQSRRFTITVWTAHGDNVTKADMNFIKTQAEASRIYFDIPAELQPSFEY